MGVVRIGDVVSIQVVGFGGYLWSGIPEPLNEYELWTLKPGNGDVSSNDRYHWRLEPTEVSKWGQELDDTATFKLRNVETDAVMSGVRGSDYKDGGKSLSYYRYVVAQPQNSDYEHELSDNYSWGLDRVKGLKTGKYEYTDRFRVRLPLLHDDRWLMTGGRSKGNKRVLMADKGMSEITADLKKNADYYLWRFDLIAPFEAADPPADPSAPH